MMPKHLVTALGLVVSLGVIALGVFLVALPLYFQAVNVDTQTTTVAATNAVYQAQVEHLTEAQGDLDQINADVADLRAQIPATGQFDDVFEVVGRAAEQTGVQLTAVTAGAAAPFVVATAPADDDSDATAAPTPVATDEATNTTDSTTTPATTAAPASEGRQQVEFQIVVSASDMSQATAFLDALRAGPRLLSSITATSTQSGEGAVSLQISALTYVDEEG